MWNSAAQNEGGHVSSLYQKVISLKGYFRKEQVFSLYTLGKEKKKSCSVLSSNAKSAYCSLIYVQHVRIMGMKSTGHTSRSHKYVVQHSESFRHVSSNGSLNKRNKQRWDHQPDLRIMYLMAASYVHKFTGTEFYHHV